MKLQEFNRIIETAAANFGLDANLIRAIIMVESSGNPWAIRAEPGFYRRYVEPMDKSDTEEWARSISWGLMQVMGQVAREHGFNGPYLSALCNPEAGIHYGAKHLARFMRKYGEKEAIASYNAGSPRRNKTTGRLVNQGYVTKVLKWKGRFDRDETD